MSIAYKAPQKARSVGVGSVFRFKAAAVLAAVAALALGPAVASATEPLEPKDVHWSFEGPFGKFDQSALQRGYKVYAEICSACHSMNLLSYRNLAQKDGPFYNPKYPNPSESPYAKAIAADIKVPDIDPDTGDPTTRPGIPADHFKNPWANEAAARASNGGALPPDLSVITKAREGGPAYVYSLITGYVDPPAGLTVPDGKYYNPYFPGNVSAAWSGPINKVPAGGFIGMPFQLYPDRVTFDDGTKATTEQEAHDVVTFLTWASDPKQTERKQTGFAVMIYLIIFAGIVYLSYRRIWRNIDH
jgi:ubiquinol-cytochrome c reductase cytochrome c1 subunit